MGDTTESMVIGGHHQCGHAHHGLSRRTLLMAGAATAAASAIGVGPMASAATAGGRGRGHGHGRGTPSPVGGYSAVLKGLGMPEVPFFIPIEVDPFTGLPAGGPFDPSLLSDFSGHVGVVEADGVTADNSEGVERRWACDIRYMSGTYQDRDGRRRKGAFTFL